tara:strand:- start:96 stop:536 length:441 start_codon:yes stop_codon:yes gene_type:complete
LKSTNKFTLSVDQTEKILLKLIHNKTLVPGNQDTYKYPLVYSLMVSKYDKNILARGQEKTMGFPNLRKNIRNKILASHYVDLDLTNCHPTLLYQYALDNKILHLIPKIIYYIENRALFLEQDPEYKTKFLSSMFGGHVKNSMKSEK